MENFWKKTFQEGLDNAGYKYQLKYQPPKPNQKTRSRKRKVVWFNPPWAANVKTNVGGKFLKLINKHFPKQNPLSKVVNRNTVKVSYRTTPNLKRIISAHNAKILRKNYQNTEKSCNCRKKNECPLNGECLTKNVIYQAKIVTNQPKPESHTYVGLSVNFKDRFRNHKQTMEKRKYGNQTTLSKFVWDLKDKNIDFDLTWKILDRAQPYNPIQDVCNLCTLEKYYLIFKPETASINENEEINSYCLHKDPLLLDKT